MALIINPKIKLAMENNIPIVGLESTVLSFGLPYPRNLEAAYAFEKIVTESGCVPATIGIYEGNLIVGLTSRQFEIFCKPVGISKCSRRDIPVVSAFGGNGATTVSGTMAILHAAGIRFFATGGLGGVHRGGEESMDISADLREFERSEVCVVSSGTKSILDPKRTLEYLETSGVPVIGYKTSNFPLFYSRESGINLTHSVDNPEETANICQECFNFSKSGLLICNPVPEEAEISNKKLKDIFLKQKNRLNQKEFQELISLRLY